MSGKGASDFGCGNRPSGEEARDHGGQRFERSKRRSGGFGGTEDVRGSERGRVGPWGASGAQLGSPDPSSARLATICLKGGPPSRTKSEMRQCGSASLDLFEHRDSLCPPTRERPGGAGHPLTSCPPQPGKPGLSAWFPAPEDVDFPWPWGAHDSAKSQTLLQELHLSDQGGSPTSFQGQEEM